MPKIKPRKDRLKIKRGVVGETTSVWEAARGVSSLGNEGLIKQYRTVGRRILLVLRLQKKREDKNKEMS